MAEYSEDEYKIHPVSSIYKQIGDILYFYEVKNNQGKATFRRREFDLKDQILKPPGGDFLDANDNMLDYND